VQKTPAARNRREAKNQNIEMNRGKRTKEILMGLRLVGLNR
jgi:hypothetical protein